MRTSALTMVTLFLALLGCAGELPTVSSELEEGPAAARSANAYTAELPFAGTVHGHETDLEVGPPTYIVRIDGSGTAMHLGRFTEVTFVRLDVMTFAGPEEMTLTAANGDAITAIGLAQGSVSDDGLSLFSVETMTISGGTGRFAGATGQFVVRRTFNPATFTSTGQFEGSISLAH